MRSRRGRLSVRPVFRTAERRPEVYFYTSNDPKFLQARLVFERAGLVLRHFRSRREPYAEDYREGKERLLIRALAEVLADVGKNVLLFVEDTSLRIDALSQRDTDFPGLAVKEWFAGTSFAAVDAQLRRARKNRRATVKSDIALHIPGLDRPVFFHGETSGVIASTPPSFGEAPEWPWLTPTTFNGWLVPDGATRRLGEMSLDESSEFDFRAAALVDLVDRLEEYAAALNLPSQAYSRRRTWEHSRQLSLLEHPVFVVVGRTCAGKTTFAERSAARHGLHLYEASSVLRSLGDDYEELPTDPCEFARHVMEKKGADAVARRIVQFEGREPHDGIIISGFRTIDEVEVIRKAWPQAVVVLVEASERTRFERHRRRGRAGAVATVREFKALDETQWTFGLLRVAEDFADIVVRNEGQLEEYAKQIDAVVTGRWRGIRGISTRKPRREREKDQLFRCLSVLADAGRPLSCDEIEGASVRYGRRIRHNNANKVLKKVPELARRLKSPGLRVRYDIADAGRAYLRLMNRRGTRQA